jgi:carbon storage regulator
MLVLSRKKSEKIVLGDGIITLTVVEIRGDKVRIGVDAPKDISVHRKEVYDAIMKRIAEENEDGNEGEERKAG